MVLKRRSFCDTLGSTLLPGLSIRVVTFSYFRAHSGDSQNDMFRTFALWFLRVGNELVQVVRHARTKKRTTALVL